MKKSSWPEFAIKDLEEQISDKQERRSELVKIKMKQSGHYINLLKRRVNVAKKKIVHDERLNKMGRGNIYQKQ